MKYTIQENSDGTHTLLRYGEPALSRDGMPTNAELEFWFEIERLREFVRIETANGLGVSIPADFILAVDRVLTATRESGNSLSVEHVCERRGEWCATAAGEQGFGATPWGAIVALGEALKQ